ncbi:hypothetical protein [Erythrobacter sp. YT30]|uniref:hypothetical protein n=1 Tax=Erythrobacter sp. YT30 TaxID=1735012 RepID=UPI00076C7F4B|nr:hypothetical protein [Erythrobacter sp. YT30]KWV91930.1 hypothetical protein AUC45_12230 [Erythrobacter sp. YT30]
MVNSLIPKPFSVVIASAALPFAAAAYAAMAHEEPAQAQKITIPERFHGTWDAVGSDCSGMSDTMLSVSETRLIFHESVATITALRTDADAIIVDVSALAEGEHLETAYRLEIVNGQLWMEVAGTNYGAFKRERCPQKTR